MAQQPHFSLQVLTPPTLEPVTLLEVQAWLRVDSDYENDKLAAIITAARTLVEGWLGKSLLPTSWQMNLDRFPLIPNSQYSPGNPNALTPVLQNTWPLDPSAWAIIIPRAPLISVDSVKYFDTGNNLQTMPSNQYFADLTSAPPRVAPVTGSYWPPCIYNPNSVQVAFTAGYADVPSVPQDIKLLIKSLAGWLYDNPNAAGQDDPKEMPWMIKTLVAAQGVNAVW